MALHHYSGWLDAGSLLCSQDPGGHWVEAWLIYLTIWRKPGYSACSAAEPTSFFPFLFLFVPKQRRQTLSPSALRSAPLPAQPHLAPAPPPLPRPPLLLRLALPGRLPPLPPLLQAPRGLLRALFATRVPPAPTSASTRTAARSSAARARAVRRGRTRFAQPRGFAQITRFNELGRSAFDYCAGACGASRTIEQVCASQRK